MLEDGMRLQIDIAGKDFNIIDKLSDRMVVYKLKTYVSDDIPHVELIAHLNSLIGQLLDAKVSTPMISRDQTNHDTVTIIERQHCRFEVTTPTSHAECKDGKLRCVNKAFKVVDVVTALSYVVSTLGSEKSKFVNPKTSYVRRLADLHAFAIRGGEHIIIVHEDNIHGNMCENVLFDTSVLSLLCVDIHADEGIVYLYDNTLEPIGTMPYDASYEAYFNTESVESED